MAASALTQDEREMREHMLGQVVNYCPMGCQQADLDEYGYCPHLVGFLRGDGKTIEKIVIRRKHNPTTNEWEEGNKFVSGNAKNLDTLRPDDKRVNPTFIQKTDGISHVVNRWVNDRVYRLPEEKAPEPKAEPAKKK